MEATPRASMQYLIYLKLGKYLHEIRITTHPSSLAVISLNSNCPPLVCLSAVTMLLEIAWLIFGVVWLKEFYLSCPTDEAKEIMFGK